VTDYKTFFASAGIADINPLPIALPSLEEQVRIVLYLKREFAYIQKALDAEATQIQKLNEYKTTLINSAVTGKVKVHSGEVMSIAV